MSLDKKYIEVQMFTQWWLWTLLCGLGFLPAYGIYKQIIIGDPWGSNPMSNWGLLLFAAITWTFIYFFTKLTLTTEIDEEKITINYKPLANKIFFWEEIVNAEIIDYGFVGGWGVRYSRKGVVYNVRGRIGLLVELENGKKYIIGTQKEQEMEEFLNQLSDDKT